MVLERRTAMKVPELTVYFWIIKVLTTGMGETTSDFFIHRVGVNNTVALAGIGVATGLVLAISLAVQLVERRYVPGIYWFAVVMVSVFGTMAADAVHIVVGVPYIVSSVFFAVVLAALFVAWNASEKTLSIHSICTRKREAFYWLVVLTTFALGTATGDMTAISLHLGYLSSGVLFAVFDRRPRSGLLAVRAERCVRVLVRLHPDAAARRVVRRLAGRIAGQRRSRAGVRTGQLGVGDRDRRLRCVPLGHRTGCSGQNRRPCPVRSATRARGPLIVSFTPRPTRRSALGRAVGEGSPRIAGMEKAPRSPAEAGLRAVPASKRTQTTGAASAGEPASTRETTGVARSGEEVLNPLTMR